MVFSDKVDGPGLNRAAIKMIAHLNDLEEQSQKAQNATRLRKIRERLVIIEEVEEILFIKLMNLVKEYSSVMHMTEQEISGLQKHAKTYKDNQVVLAQIKPIMDAKDAERRAIEHELKEIKSHMVNGAKRGIKRLSIVGNSA